MGHSDVMNADKSLCCKDNDLALIFGYVVIRIESESMKTDAAAEFATYLRAHIELAGTGAMYFELTGWLKRTSIVEYLNDFRPPLKIPLPA